jgi:LacI family transcriptional regulator
MTPACRLLGVNQVTSLSVKSRGPWRLGVVKRRRRGSTSVSGGGQPDIDTIVAHESTDMPNLNNAIAGGAASTVTDVARLAGVSVSTVSRILNGSARVAPDKRESVEAAIKKLQFRPNLSARSLRSGTTHTIGILTQDLESPYFTGGTKGIEQGLEGSGFAPLVVPGHWNRQEEFDRARLLMARKVDAMIILGGTLEDAQVVEMAQRQPIAITGRQLKAPNVFCFHVDQIAGAQMATRHLIELGHRRIAHIAGPADRLDANERKEGFFRAHRDAHLSVDPRLLVDGNYIEEGGLLAVRRLLETKVRFTAIFCANDQTLWGARLALHQHGLEVPRDVSLVGFDDMPQCMYMTPPVTTVRQPIYDMGRAAARAVLRALQGPQVEIPALPALALIVRDTTQPPRDA